MYSLEEKKTDYSDLNFDQQEDSDIPRSPKCGEVKAQVASFWDVLSFGICVSACNLFIDWSSGFRTGYWDFLFSTIVTSTTFICLYLSVAEMVSMLPFSGKSSFKI
jgi:hypothetical protein